MSNKLWIFIHFSFVSERQGKFHDNLQIEKQEKESMLDWDATMKDVVDGEDTSKKRDTLKDLKESDV